MTRKLRPEVVDAIEFVVRTWMTTLREGAEPELVMGHITQYIVELLELPKEAIEDIYEPTEKT